MVLIDRRHLLKLGGMTLGSLLSQTRHLSWAQRSSRPPRFVVFYFPDGVPGVSERGEASQWDCRGSEREFSLSECLYPLARHKEHCLFLNGLSMGPTDSGSHPGGAKKLLTGVDGGNGRSLDQYLAQILGEQTPFKSIYLSAMTTLGNPPSDCYISYRDAGQTMMPEDDPRVAFQRLFGGRQSAGYTEMAPAITQQNLSVLNGVMSEINHLRREHSVEARFRLDQQLNAVRELELRLARMNHHLPSSPSNLSCQSPTLGTAVDELPSLLHDPALFPTILNTQSDLMALSLACGLTRVGVIQCSRHTSELIMSRFPDTPFSDLSFDMRSHQASHYGASHDRNRREFTDFVAQRIWFVEQFAQFLDRLITYPDGDGTLLDSTMVLLCSEVSDGNTHKHDNMPFVLAGGQSLGINSGRLLQLNGRRHSDLLTSICHLVGDQISGFGQDSSGPINEIWT